MVDLLYDGSFEGFLCCVYSHYYEEKAEGIYLEKGYQGRLGALTRTVPTREDQATKVYDAIGKKISHDALKRVYHVWLSNTPDKETLSLAYLIQGFRLGGGIDLLHADPVVYAMQQAEHKVTLEAHRFIGLVRFQELLPDLGRLELGRLELALAESLPTAILYSGFQPDHDIVELLANHFSRRFREEFLILHDKGRNKAVFAQGGDWYVSEFTEDQLSGLGQRDKTFELLWREYYHGIAIKERTNPRCQKRFMPVRYWKYLTEMK